MFKYPTERRSIPEMFRDFCAKGSRIESTLPGFNLLQTISDFQDPVIEIGGPTDEGFKIIHNQLPSVPHVLNVKPLYSSKLETAVITDARRLPLKENSVSMILASCLTIVPVDIVRSPDCDEALKMAYEEYAEYQRTGGDHQVIKVNNRIGIIEESARAIVPGGLIVWQGGTSGDRHAAELNSLELVKHAMTDSTLKFQNEDNIWHEYVFQKIG